jgi:hypothetical protein
VLQLTRLEIDGAFRCASADVTRIAGCCPGLQQLHFRTYPSEGESGTQLAVLSSLTNLTSLSISGVSDSMAASLAQLSCLSKLEELCIKEGSGFHEENLQDAGLRQLTALTQLTSLKFSAQFLGHSICKISERFQEEESPSGSQFYIIGKKVGIWVLPTGWL